VWDDLLEEGVSNYDKERFDFVFHKLYKHMFTIKHLNHKVWFMVHPYAIRDNVLIVEVRSFNIKGMSHRDFNYRDFLPQIEEKILKFVDHLDIKSIKVVDGQTSKEILSEGTQDLEALKNKQYRNYLTPVGILSFTLANVNYENSVLRYEIKDFYHLDDERETYRVDDVNKPYVERIVRDDSKSYGFRDANFGGQINIHIN
jgi:hypothetical protein